MLDFFNDIRAQVTPRKIVPVLFVIRKIDFYRSTVGLIAVAQILATITLRIA